MKKIIAIILLLATILPTLASCGLFSDVEDNEAGETGGTTPEEPGTSSGNGDSKPEYEYGTATVFMPGDSVMIVSAGVVSDTVQSLKTELEQLLKSGGAGGRVFYGSVYNEKQHREVAIGVTDEQRPATVKAEKAMLAVEKGSLFELRYAVYAEGGCIAFAYDKNEYTNLQSVDFVIEDFIKSYISGKNRIAIPEGLVCSGRIDLKAEQVKLDEIQLMEEWETLASVAGADVAEACKTLYSLYGKEMIEWAASLYDPGVGGYYASTAGKEGLNFGPDLQCTVQMLRFISQTGMTKNIISSTAYCVPKEMEYRMVYFAKSLQDTNGYFYHPQWGKELTDKYISRRSRDLGWGTSLTTEFGSRPVYDTPGGTKGDGITADEYWDSLVAAGEISPDEPRPYTYDKSPKRDITTGELITTHLGASAAALVSKLISPSYESSGSTATLAAKDSYGFLSSHTGFINYLLTYVEPGLHSSPYATGNEVGSTTSQIATSSNKLGVYTYISGDESATAGASAEDYMRFDGMTLKEMLVSVVVGNINPVTGLWGDLTASKPNGTEFCYTNGFMKTIGILTGWEVGYPAEYVAKAASAIVGGILGDEPSTSNCCDIYNVWTCVGLLKSNLKYVDAEVRKQVTADVNAILTENAAAAILKTYEKIKGYKKEDGGFAHNYYKGTANHQNLPVSDGSNISDVDGTCISSTGLTRAIFEALGLSKYKPSMYTESDWMRYLEILLSGEVAVKNSYPEKEIHDFETAIPGAPYFVCVLGHSENSASIKNNNGSNALLINKVNTTAQAYFTLQTNYTENNANIAIFEMDLMFEDIVSFGNYIELRMYTGEPSNTTKFITVQLYKGSGSDKGIYACFSDSTSNRVKVGEIGKSFNIRIDYGVNGSTNKAVASVIIDGTTTVLEKTINSAVSVSEITHARFVPLTAFKGKIYIDNLGLSHRAE